MSGRSLAKDRSRTATTDGTCRRNALGADTQGVGQRARKAALLRPSQITRSGKGPAPWSKGRVDLDSVGPVGTPNRMRDRHQ